MKQRLQAISFLHILIILLTAALACGTATDVVREASKNSNVADAQDARENSAEDHPESAALDDTSEEIVPTTISAPSAATKTPANTPTATVIPPTPTPNPERLQVVKSGFGQNGRDVGFAFLLENPNEGLALEDTQYQVTIFDSSGTILETRSGYINLVLPGEKIGMADTLFLDEGAVADSMEVRLSGGNAVASEPLPNFTTDMIRYYSDDFSPRVTAIVESPFNRDFTDVRVSAVLYDENSNIVGGGFTYLNFVPAEGTVGLQMTVDGLENVENVELYPVLSTLSLLGDSDAPEDSNPPSLIQSGYGYDGRDVGYGMLIENPNSNYAIEGLLYQVAAYATDGSVLGTDSGYVPPLLAEQTLGLGGDIFLIEEQPIERLEMQISGGRFVEGDSKQLPFTTEDARFQPGDFSNRVTGFIVNPYDQDVTNLFVSAIVYNEAGDIVGGGYTFLDFASAQDRTAVEVRVEADSTASSAELYATFSTLSDFQ